MNYKNYKWNFLAIFNNFEENVLQHFMRYTLDIFTIIFTLLFINELNFKFRFNSD